MVLAVTIWGIVGLVASFAIGSVVAGYIFALSGKWDDDTVNLVILASVVGVLSAIGEAIFGFWTWKWIAFAPCLILIGWLATVSMKFLVPFVRECLARRRERKAHEVHLAHKKEERAKSFATDRKTMVDLERQIQEVRERHAWIERENAEHNEQEQLRRARQEEQVLAQREAQAQKHREEERRRQERRTRLRKARLSAEAAKEFRNLSGQRKSELRELFRKHGLKTFEREWAERVFTKADNHLESPYANIRSRFNIRHKTIVLEVAFTPDMIVLCQFGKASVSDPDWSGALRFFESELNALQPVATGA